MEDLRVFEHLLDTSKGRGEGRRKGHVLFLEYKVSKMYSSVSPRSKIKINFKERIVFTMWHLGASPLILTFAPQQIRPICHDSSINYNLTLGNQGSLSVQLTPKFTFLTQKFFFKVSFSFLFPIYLSKNCQVPIESF